MNMINSPQMQKFHQELIQSFSRALNREMHILSRHPKLLWQQLYNRLQWDGDSVKTYINPEYQSRISQRTRSWFKSRMAYTESKTLIRSFVGHTDRVSYCDISPDGKWCVSASQDGTLKIWDVETGNEIQTLRGHEGGVNRCAISPDGSYIVSASWDETLKIWDPKTGNEHVSLSGHSGPVTECKISPTGKIIASAGWDNMIILWDPVSGCEIGRLGEQSPQSYSPYTFCLSPNGRWISSVLKGKLVVWDSTTEENRIIEGAFNPQTGGPYAFSLHGSIVAYASNDAMVRLWDRNLNREIAAIRGHSTEKVPMPEIGAEAYVTDPAVTACDFSPDGSYLVTGSNLGYLRMWDMTRRREELLPARHDREVTSICFSRDGELVITGSEDQTIKITHLESRQERGTLHGHNDRITQCTVTPDGKKILSASSDGAMNLWKIPDEVSATPTPKHQNRVSACALSTRGHLAISSSHDGTLAVWETKSAQRQVLCHGHIGSIEDCGITPDDRYVFSWSDDMTLRFWDPINGSAQALFPLADLSSIPGGTMAPWYVKKCLASPDGKYVLALSRSALEIWNLRKGKREFRLQYRREKGIGDDFLFLPDGEQILSVGNGDVAIWDIRKGKCRKAFPGSAPIAANPDGQWVIHGSKHDNTLSVSEIRSGKKMQDFSGHSSKVLTCTVSKNGNYVVSGSQDGIMIIWDVPRNVLIAKVKAHKSHVWRCLITPDNKNVVTIGGDQMLCLWDMKSGKAVNKFPLFAKGTTFAMDRTQPLVVVGDVGGAVYLLDIIA